VKQKTKINANKPVTGCETENEEGQIEKWCKLARGVKAKVCKIKRRKTRIRCSWL